MPSNQTAELLNSGSNLDVQQQQKKTWKPKQEQKGFKWKQVHVGMEFLEAMKLGTV